jgi:uncharacterized surface protein with fasciclin (FAS1) repeats
MLKAASSILTVVDAAAQQSNLSTFCSALKSSELLQSLKEGGPFTLFAPNNETFSKIPSNVFKDLLKKENKDKLQKILSNHIIPYKLVSLDIKPMTFLTISGKELVFSQDGSKWKVNNAHIIKVDIHGSNGVVHIIDALLMP